MFLGEKIAFFRKMHGMTQKILGLKMGLSPQNADARIAQYECGRESHSMNAGRAHQNRR